MNKREKATYRALKRMVKKVPGAVLMAPPKRRKRRVKK